MSYRLIIFDWDGTLLDSTGHIVNSVQRAARDLNWQLPDNRAVKDIIGLGLPEAIRALFPDSTEDDVRALRSNYARHFMDENQDTSCFFAGVPDLLHRLHESGFLLGLATGKARPGLERVWRKHRVGHFFHASRCSDECPSKPDPGMVLELLETLSVAPGEAVLVGDTRFDLDMAQSAGVAGVGVRYGAHPPAVLEQSQPLALVDDLGELMPLLGLEHDNTETVL
jgi:phosphoglycolate phosphatase